MADENETKKIQPTILEITDSNDLTIVDSLNKPNEIKEDKKENKKNLLINESVYTLFKNLDTPAVLTDEKKNIIYINDSFAKLINVTSDVLSGSKLTKYIKKNFIIYGDKKIEIDVKEIPIGLVSIFLINDLESKKEIENNKERITILDQIEEGVIEVAKNWKIISFNNTAKELIPEIKEGENVKKLIKINKLNSVLKEILVQNKVETEGSIIGKSIPLSIKIIPKNSKFVLILKNKQEQIKLNDQIRIVQEQYEQLVNNTTDIICIIDKNGIFKFVNKQFEKQLHYKQPYPKLFEIIHPEDMHWFVRLLTECELQKKGFQDKEIRMYNSKKKMIYFAVSALPLIHDNNVTEYSITLRDITEKKKSEDETVRERERLREDYKRLSEINRMKTEFVSMVSHDLKTPLTNIQGYASLLRNKMLGPNTPKQQEAVEIIDKEAKRLAKLINDLLDLSKLDAGAMVLHKKIFRLKDLEEKCSLRNLAEQKGLTLIWNTPETLSEVYGDPERIAQVLTNLVNNAIKFTDKGSVTINAFEKDKNWIQVDVIDTGPGIPKKEQELIFDRFQRSSVSKLYKKEGSGLGLAIAKEIMKLHDSDITVKSEVGKGSVFSIYLPKAKTNKILDKEKVDEYIERLNIENTNNNTPNQSTNIPTNQENKEKSI